MLMDHKNFHFTQIPDKTNNTIFLKTMSLGHFRPFLVIFARWAFFPKKSGSVTHNYIWPLTPWEVSEKLMCQSGENLRRDGRTEGRAEGRRDHYRTVPAEARGPIKEVCDLF